MTKYFYRDPQEAAYMLRHGFLIEDFTCIFVHHSFHAGLTDWIHLNSFPGDVDFGFYILPESISLLKPQIGDVVEHPSLGFWKITNFSEFQGRPVAQSNEDRSFLVTEIKSIIQRDGKPFFWPESA